GGQFFGPAIIAAVAIIGVELVAAAGPDRAQVQRNRVRHLDIQTSRQAGVAIAVVFFARRIARIAVRVVTAGGQTPTDALARTADPPADIGRAARAGLGVEAALPGLGRLGRDDIDHAADGLAAPQGGLGAAQYFDARRVADQQIAEIAP